GTIDIPQQMAQGLLLKKIKVTKADSVFFEFSTGLGLARFEGVISDSTISGCFHQAGRSFPFELSKKEKQADQKALNMEDLPYQQKELTIRRDSVIIAGTLTYPKNTRAQKGLILISGSGAQNRDEEIFGFKPFAQIANHLSANG